MIKKTFEDFILMLEHSSSLLRQLDRKVEESNPESWKKNKNFLHKFHGFLSGLPGPSWNNIAPNSHRPFNSEEAWYEINNELKSAGLDWKDVKDNKEVILDNIDCYSSLNAFVDIILYSLDSNYNVGGYDDSVSSNLYEIGIKYRYGYHQTTYGIIFLKRYWGSIDNFIEKYAKNILHCFIQSSSCIDRADLKDILEEIDENKGFTNWEDGILTLYFEAFYLSAKHGIVSADVHKLNYESFKSFFMNWIHMVNSELVVEDYDDHLEIDFNCDL